MGFGPLSGRNPGACVAVTVTALLGSLRAVCKHFWSCLVGDTRSASGVPLAQIEWLLLNLSMTDFLHVIKRDSVAEEGITSIVFRALKLSISCLLWAFSLYHHEYFSSYTATIVNWKEAVSLPAECFFTCAFLTNSGKLGWHIAGELLGQGLNWWWSSWWKVWLA